ncbi:MULTISPECIES: imidazoleglycerol-phosphate dehydratase HisB [Intestinimonas]|jgi:imidazoleglycerol-phosphate dehydratase|uniref:Imidazoleglycerol-phosphate dehydratase n=1 Tax=Intestinimonas butyriciproducens TaxID=1297617 RepID=A0A2U1CEA3_9FIRM|nr:imidazoleglycerol-phosphate dehydratase HisB [Intestinimonas butyriciproducens]MBS6521798.1 imidazoleglycerol-phosphate dehydratase HisB [Clostridiales bacterium]SCI70208.1 Histidine biosynthesis bifunctional protein hisB [uncultured Clostridium sp.]MBO3279917.1 imidazoleglycerol-phosphate dehydratase HisB [Intestinimonas butyriciproducens]MBU5229184.1 imidazoleglycerol-phosphate dehydratase HisB [Intestinimonas butyriciproducens]MCB7049336.1 imidazoleglycerol-phosphate dehydratase HisB [In
MARISNISRETKETSIQARLNLGGGEVRVDTGIGFLDHMLHAMAFYAGFGLDLTARGDLNVDGHHTVEDTGIVLGQAIREALGDKRGIRRFGSAYVPMDEALAFTSLDFSGRAFLVFDADMPQERIGDYDSCLTEEFMRALAFNGGITLHQRGVYGKNAHHITEALFKSLGLAMKDAVRVEGQEVTSTKGVL